MEGLHIALEGLQLQLGLGLELGLWLGLQLQLGLGLRLRFRLQLQLWHGGDAVSFFGSVDHCIHKGID